MEDTTTQDYFVYNSEYYSIVEATGNYHFNYTIYGLDEFGDAECRWAWDRKYSIDKGKLSILNLYGNNYNNQYPKIFGINVEKTGKWRYTYNLNFDINFTGKLLIGKNQKKNTYPGDALNYNKILEIILYKGTVQEIIDHSSLINSLNEVFEDYYKFKESMKIKSKRKLKKEFESKGINKSSEQVLEEMEEKAYKERSKQIMKLAKNTEKYWWLGESTRYGWNYSGYLLR